MDVLFGLLFALVGLGIVFVLPIASLVYAYLTRTRLARLERSVAEQREALDRLTTRIADLRREVRTGPLREEPVAVDRPAAPARPVTPPVAPPVEAKPRSPLVEHKLPVLPSPLLPRPEPRTPSPEPRAAAFDWESLVGVKLFSAIAGIALVIAAISFLRYSIEHGWLQPPVRVLIGVVVGVGLLVACEMKAARKYPVTANALDAAAIAILFATFFAAHALWGLIPASVTFALLAVVTAVAVLLSIRRESLFIAVLGLLGGFATPWLLSTGDNRPIPLFAYLLLLNVGLAWVAHRQAWPILSVLTLVLTTIYQWGWVLKYLTVSEPSLAMAIFLVFPVVTFAVTVVARRGGADSAAERTFQRTALVSAALPLLFALYLAAVPLYGLRAPLLFGFLLLIDAGLLAIAIARRQPLLHAAGAVATLLVPAIWLAQSYASGARLTVIGFTAAFVLLYLGAPMLARRLGRPLEAAGEQAEYAAPALLFVFAALAAMEPAFARPLVPFAVLAALLVLCAVRAIAAGKGYLYFIAAFFAVAAQAVWSATFLTAGRLGTAVALYAAFGVVSLGVPLLARRLGKPLEPPAAAGLMLLASLALLLYLTSDAIAPEALWALALLLAIINAGLFIESAHGRLPIVAQAGSLLSWVVLGTWWWRAAGSVGVYPSLAVLTGLTLLTLGGHAWAHTYDSRDRHGAEQGVFADGVYLGLAGHLFLFMLALNREWSVPPWPLFGTLAVLTLAATATSLLTRAPDLHLAGVLAASIVIAVWTPVSGVEPWPLVATVASGAVAAYALAWRWLARHVLPGDRLAVASVAALFATELTTILAAAAPGAPPFAAILATHAVTLTVLLAVAWTARWPVVSLGAVAVASAAVFLWQDARDLAAAWPQLLMLAGAIYAIFTAYPLVLGRRASEARQPWVAALVAAAMAFFAARAAFEAGGLEWMVGIIPVIEGVVSAVLLRALLGIQPPGERDLGRLALVAGAALAFVTVAIPLQLEEQWITIGWALEGAALAWLYRRIPHRGLLLACLALLATVFVRLALNPDVFRYEPRGELRILNWYLYTYLISAAALLAGAWWLSRTDDEMDPLPRASRLLAGGAVILLFLLLNIEIADFYATGPEIVFRFGAGVSQDLTYTIGWLVFGMGLLAAGIYSHAKAPRIAALALITVTAFKCFLYDLGSLQGLYRVASFVGLAVSLALVSLALQKFVLLRPKDAA